MRSLADKKFISDKFDASGHRDITESYCILKYNFGKNYFTFPAQVYHINLAGSQSQLLFSVPGTTAVFTRMWKQERFLMRNNYCVLACRALVVSQEESGKTPHCQTATKPQHHKPGLTNVGFDMNLILCHHNHHSHSTLRVLRFQHSCAL